MEKGICFICDKKSLHGIYCNEHAESILGLQVRASHILGAGMGLFTTIDRKKGDFICEYTGRILLKDESPSPFAFRVMKDLIIDADHVNDQYGRYANMCRTQNIQDGIAKGNNVKFVINVRTKQVCFRAIRNIHRGEEIYVGYGNPGYWKVHQSQ